MDGDEETWAVREAEDWLELARIAHELACVLPLEVLGLRSNSTAAAGQVKQENGTDSARSVPRSHP
jgi:hypothetical protein